MTPTSDDTMRSNCRTVAKSILDGTVVPFFGAGVNLANRPPDETVPPGRFLPDAGELSRALATEFDYKWKDVDNLPRVSWFAAIRRHRTLYRYLHDIFSADYEATDVLRFFAQLPKKLSAKGSIHRHQLIVTTNYDDGLERAFVDEREPFDLLTYVAHGTDKRKVGKFRHRPYGGEPQIIDNPINFPLPIENGVLERTIILKIHGAVDRTDWHLSSFVITEDDYINYLARMNTPDYQIPALLMEKMKDSSFLFLGYRLADWNLRVLLHSISSSQPLTDTSWAIMHETEDWDETYWREHDVEFMKRSLRDYVAVLGEELDALPIATGAV
jgi:hypothetical protein